MHDRENTSAFVIIGRGADQIGKQADNIRVSSIITWRVAGPDKAIKITSNQHFIKRFALWRRFDGDISGKLKFDFFRPVRRPNTAANPVNIGWLDAVIIFKKAAGPYIGG